MSKERKYLVEQFWKSQLNFCLIWIQLWYVNLQFWASVYLFEVTWFFNINYCTLISLYKSYLFRSCVQTTQKSVPHCTLFHTGGRAVRNMHKSYHMSCVASFVLPGVVRPYGTILNKVCFNKKQDRQTTSKDYLSLQIKLTLLSL